MDWTILLHLIPSWNINCPLVPNAIPQSFNLEIITFCCYPQALNRLSKDPHKVTCDTFSPLHSSSHGLDPNTSPDCITNAWIPSGVTCLPPVSNHWTVGRNFLCEATSWRNFSSLIWFFSFRLDIASFGARKNFESLPVVVELLLSNTVFLNGWPILHFELMSVPKFLLALGPCLQTYPSEEFNMQNTGAPEFLLKPYHP